MILCQNALYFLGPKCPLMPKTQTGQGEAREGGPHEEAADFSAQLVSFSDLVLTFLLFFLGRSLYLQLFIIILLICCLLTARTTKTTTRTITTMPRRATIAPRKIKKGAHRKEGNARWHPKNFCRPPKKLCQTKFKCFPNEKNLQKKDDGKGQGEKWCGQLKTTAGRNDIELKV